MSLNAADEQDTTGWVKLNPMLDGATCHHGCAKIDEYRMIIVGGHGNGLKTLACGAIYDTRTQQWTRLPNDMPTAIYACRVVADEKYVFVVGGADDSGLPVNTLYRLSLESYEWTTMAPMVDALDGFAIVLKGGCIYVFGDSRWRARRYVIADNSWEDLLIPPDDTPNQQRGQFNAVAVGNNDIYIVGGFFARPIDIFDTVLLCWRDASHLHRMPHMRACAAAVLLKDRYLVVIGGRDDMQSLASCSIYDCLLNGWRTAPSSMNILNGEFDLTGAAVLGEKIVLVSGSYTKRGCLSSMEYVGVDDLLRFAPVVYPIPTFYFNRILLIGKADIVDDSGVGDDPSATRKKAKVGPDIKGTGCPFSET